MSTAFDSDALLRFADQSIRNSAEFQAAVNAAGPNQSITLNSNDLGINLGRGYERLGTTGNPTNNRNTQGPVRRVDNLRKATATYVKNPITGQWETITVYPGR